MNLLTWIIGIAVVLFLLSIFFMPTTPFDLGGEPEDVPEGTAEGMCGDVHEDLTLASPFCSALGPSACANSSSCSWTSNGCVDNTWLYPNSYWNWNYILPWRWSYWSTPRYTTYYTYPRYTYSYPRWRTWSGQRWRRSGTRRRR